MTILWRILIGYCLFCAGLAIVDIIRNWEVLREEHGNSSWGVTALAVLLSPIGIPWWVISLIRDNPSAHSRGDVSAWDPARTPENLLVCDTWVEVRNLLGCPTLKVKTIQLPKGNYLLETPWEVKCSGCVVTQHPEGSTIEVQSLPAMNVHGEDLLLWELEFDFNVALHPDLEVIPVTTAPYDPKPGIMNFTSQGTGTAVRLKKVLFEEVTKENE